MESPCSGNHPCQLEPLDMEKIKRAKTKDRDTLLLLCKERAIAADSTLKVRKLVKLLDEWHQQHGGDNNNGDGDRDVGGDESVYGSASAGQQAILRLYGQNSFLPVEPEPEPKPEKQLYSPPNKLKGHHPAWERARRRRQRQLLLCCCTATRCCVSDDVVSDNGSGGHVYSSGHVFVPPPTIPTHTAHGRSAGGRTATQVALGITTSHNRRYRLRQINIEIVFAKLLK